MDRFDILVQLFSEVVANKPKQHVADSAEYNKFMRNSDKLYLHIVQEFEPAYTMEEIVLGDKIFEREYFGIDLFDPDTMRDKNPTRVALLLIVHLIRERFYFNTMKMPAFAMACEMYGILTDLTNPDDERIKYIREKRASFLKGLNNDL